MRPGRERAIVSIDSAIDDWLSEPFALGPSLDDFLVMVEEQVQARLPRGVTLTNTVTPVGADPEWDLTYLRA